jgi:hypothetical protein
MGGAAENARIVPNSPGIRCQALLDGHRRGAAAGDADPELPSERE